VALWRAGSATESDGQAEPADEPRRPVRNERVEGPIAAECQPERAKLFFPVGREALQPQGIAPAIPIAPLQPLAIPIAAPRFPATHVTLATQRAAVDVRSGFGRYLAAASWRAIWAAMASCVRPIIACAAGRPQ
jgi:hypothetical protein